MIAQTEFGRLAPAAEYLVDDRVGIVKQLYEVPREAGAPDFFHFAAQACDTSAFARQRNFNVTGGASARRDLAAAKALGEAVERYCAALYAVEDLPLTTQRTAPFPCVSPRDFALYSEEQYARSDFPWVPFDEDTPVRWAPAVDLLSGETCYVPAAFVYVPYFYYRGTGDAPIVQPISTGLACHSTLTQAVLSAIYEVIERDGFTLAWQAALAPPQVRVETLSDANYDLVQRFERVGDRVTLLDLTTDLGVPVILAVLRGGSSYAPALVFAAAADLDAEEAVRKCLEELAHTRRYSQQIKVGFPAMDPEPGYANVVDQITHLHFWADERNASSADFMFTSPLRKDFEEIQGDGRASPEAQLATAVDAICRCGYRVLVADITSPDVSELGLSVCRAVIPGLHPLFMGHSIRAQGGRRLWEVPQKLGYAGVARATGDNPLPHPYP